MSLIDNNKCSIVEGQLRDKELRRYLDDLDCGDVVWLCEDATGINPKVEYHPATNQLVGLKLPIDAKTGMPVPFTFLANTAEDIQTHSQKPFATLVYVVLALPLKPGVPPFVLQIFGTNNTFTAENVIQRWKQTIHDLKKYVILHAIWLIHNLFNYIYLNIQADL